MAICQKCGSKLPEDSVKCQICGEINESERKTYKRTSFYIYYISLIAAIIYTAFFILKSIINLSDIKDQTIHIEYSYLSMVKKSPASIMFYSVCYDILLPAALIIFIAVIMINKRQKLLMVMPITGILAEIALLIKESVNYSYIIRTKLSYLYGIVAMDFFVAILVTAFFLLMTKLILSDFSLSASRFLIVLGFVLFISRVILKVCMADDTEMLNFVSNTKAYTLLFSLLLDARKRYTLSKQI